MTVWDLVAVVVTVCVIVTMAILLLLLAQLISVLRDLRSAADRLADHALPAVDDLKEAVDHADVELERLQGVIGRGNLCKSSIGRSKICSRYLCSRNQTQGNCSGIQICNQSYER